MKKNIHFLSPLLLLFFIAACDGQIKTDPPKEQKVQPSTFNPHQPAMDLSDNDPYFVGSNDLETEYAPQVITRNILQDKNGHFWLATWNGIIGYDGKKFTNFTNKMQLRRYHTFSILEDTKGNLWFGTIGAGVYRYDGKNFTNFTNKEGLGDNKIECMLEDKNGNIWFSTGIGLSCYDGKTFRNFTIPDGHNDIHSLAQDKTGKIWIASNAGICFYDGKSFTNFNNESGLPFINARTIIVDSKGTIWFGGNDGLFHFDGKVLTNLTTDFVGYLYEDKKGNIWISAMQENQPDKMVLYRYASDLLPMRAGKQNFEEIIKEDGLIFGIEEDDKGGIWFGTLEGVRRYDGKKFDYFNKN